MRTIAEGLSLTSARGDDVSDLAIAPAGRRTPGSTRLATTTKDDTAVRGSRFATSKFNLSGRPATVLRTLPRVLFVSRRSGTAQTRVRLSLLLIDRASTFVATATRAKYKA